MSNLDKFIADSVTFRPSSMFENDIQANASVLTREIKGKKVCVIGGAGSIGSSFIKAVLRFEPASVVVVDLNENGLAELVKKPGHKKKIGNISGSGNTVINGDMNSNV
jgi:threonine dehydrogenase-like Zn-dependent dehydrogenase